jgi:hypothetical protein
MADAKDNMVVVIAGAPALPLSSLFGDENQRIPLACLSPGARDQ